MSSKILVSGASIAGLTLAYWLGRHGFELTVIERSPGLRAGGNGVDVRDQAIEVAERMGIMPRIRAAGADVTGMAFLDSAGEPTARMSMPAVGDEVEIMRTDLAAILFATARTGVEYVFGDSVQRLRQDDDGVAVTFEHGSPRRFDLVIGADGIHSTVRRLAFGPESRFLRYLGHYFAFSDADPDLGENRWVTAYNEPGRMAGVYRSGNHIGAKANFMFRRSELLPYDRHDTDGVRMPSWSSGRVALVGGNHEIAFRRYESGFRRTVRRMQQVGPNVRLMVPGSRLAIRARNAIARSPLLDSLAGLERIASPKSTGPLPDYERPLASRRTTGAAPDAADADSLDGE